MSARIGSIAALFLAALAALAFLAPTGLAAPAGASSPSAAAASSRSDGSLEGEVTLGPRLTARRMRFNAYPDAQAAIAAKPAHSDSARTEEFANVVVYLEAMDGPQLRATSKKKDADRDQDCRADDAPQATRVSAPRPSPEGTLAVRQDGLAFLPHVLPVVKGSSVEFPNADTVFHNVFSLSRASTFDLGRYPRGESKSVRFDAPGLVKVFCHIHSDMSAVVLVLDNPYFVVPDPAGHFRIDGIPSGEYRAVAWHERARRVSQVVRITPGGTAQASFQIPLEDPVE